MEKIDYTVSWLNAHLEDAAALGKPLLVEEFGKAVSAAKVYTGQLPHSPEKGVGTCPDWPSTWELHQLAQSMFSWRMHT